MKVERLTITGCCKTIQIVFKLDLPIKMAIQAGLLDVLKSNGFIERTQFTKVGMLYADNSDLIVTAPFSANTITVRCKKTDCEQILNDFEALLLKTG